MSKYALGRLLGLTKCRLVWSCLGHCRNEKARCGAGLRVSESLWWMLLALSLFPNTKFAEYLAQQIVRRESAGDLAQRVMGQAQLFGQQVQRTVT